MRGTFTTPQPKGWGMISGIDAAAFGLRWRKACGER